MWRFKKQYLELFKRTPNLLYAYNISFIPYCIGFFIITFISLLNVSSLLGYIVDGYFSLLFSSLITVVAVYAIWTVLIGVLYILAYISIKLSEKSKFAIFILLFLVSVIAVIVILSILSMPTEGMVLLASLATFMFVGIPVMGISSFLWAHSYTKFKEIKSINIPNVLP